MTMSMTEPVLYPNALIADLNNSGLEPSDIRPKPMGPAEKQATNTPVGVDGYAIPYFDLQGLPLPFYRVKLYNRDKVKYLQVADSPNHIYFPPKFWKLVSSLHREGNLKYVLWTEGEKKAAKCVREGIPCVAVGGVDSWKTRTLSIPKEASIAQKPSGGLSIRLPADAKVGESSDIVAKGFQELVDFVVKHSIPLIICYDTDAPQSNQFAHYSFGVSQAVQRAAAMLGFELRHRGVPFKNIRQLILPAINEDKTGLDDYLIDQGPDRLRVLIRSVLNKRAAFPRHPNTRSYVNKQLQKANLSRQDQMGLALAVLSDLDAKGQRLRSPDAGSLYYFDHEDKSLTPVTFSGKPEFAETPFGCQLYRNYNLGVNDQRTLAWLSTQFSAEEPIQDVYPEKLLCWRGDTLYYHVNDGLVARVSREGIDLIDNGEDGVLFEAGMAEGIKQEEFARALKIVQGQPIENWWEDVLKATRIRDSGAGESDGLSHKKILSLLYYVSPFFYRWRGTQLPVEITWGEAGSGKSTLFELRLAILTGIPKLRNSPSDLKDWNASLAASGGLHVTDNVQMNNVDLRNRLSDEICRLVTEPSPSIEQRKLYSDTALVRIPVRVVFGVTAIKQPFTNVDIIQRAIITEMDKGIDAELKYDAQWKEHQLANRGGRAHWLAHQLVFVQHILQVIHTSWNARHQARYRLINVEQLLMMAAQVVGWDPKWIPMHLETTRDQRAQESDWTLEGLKAWAQIVQNKTPDHYDKVEFSLQKIVDWASQEEEFKGCQLLQSSRTLKRYIETHKHTVATVTNIVEHRRTAQGSVYFHVRNPSKAKKV